MKFARFLLEIVHEAPLLRRDLPTVRESIQPLAEALQHGELALLCAGLFGVLVLVFQPGFIGFGDLVDALCPFPEVRGSSGAIACVGLAVRTVGVTAKALAFPL